MALTEQDELNPPALGAAPCFLHSMPHQSSDSEQAPFEKITAPPVFVPKVDEGLLEEIPEGEARERARIRMEAQSIRQQLDYWMWEQTRDTRSFALTLWNETRELLVRVETIESAPRRLGSGAFSVLKAILLIAATAAITVWIERLMGK